MEICPLRVEEALEWLKGNERHYKSSARPVFAIGLKMNDELVGCAVVGETGGDAELCHIYSVGEYLGYTTLYGATWRCAKAMGYKRMIL
jgi:hypothetical protein